MLAFFDNKEFLNLKIKIEFINIIIIIQKQEKMPCEKCKKYKEKEYKTCPKCGEIIDKKEKNNLDEIMNSRAVQ